MSVEISTNTGLLDYFYNNPMPMWIYDNLTLEILDANSEVAKLLGVSQSDICGLSIHDFRPKDDVTLLEEYLINNNSYNPKSTIWYLQTKNDDIILTNIYNYPICFQGKSASMVSIHKTSDIRAEVPNFHKTRKALELSQYAINAASIISITNANGIIQFVNTNFERISGYNSQELIGKNFNILNSGKHPSTFWTEMWRNIKAGKTWRSEVCNLSKFKKAYWLDTFVIPVFDDLGEFDKIVSISTDISEKKQKELKIQILNKQLEQTIIQQQIAQKELERLSLVAKFTQNMVVITNAQGDILWVNESFCRKSEFSLSEVVGKRPSTMLHGPLSNLNTLRAIRRAIEQGLPFEGESLHYTKSGLYYWALVNGEPVFNSQKEVSKYIMVMTDISEIKKQKELVLRSESELNALLSSTGALHILINPAFKIINFNSKAQESAKKLFGITLVKGEDILRGVPSESKRDFDTMVKKALEGQATYNREVFVPNTDICWMVNYLPTFNPSGEILGVVFTALDISERKKEELEVIRTQILLSQAESIANMGSWELDVDSGQLNWSDQHYHICHLPPQSIIPTLDFVTEKIIHPQDKSSFINFIDTIIHDKKMQEIELHFLLDNQFIKIIRLKAQPILNEKQVVKRIVGVARDISLQKATQEKEEMERVKHSALVQNMPDPVYSLDMNLNFVSFNKAFEKQTSQLTQTQPLVGMNAHEYFAKGIRQDYRQVIEPCLKGQSLHFEMCMPINNIMQYMEVSANPIFNDLSEQIGIIVFVRNITARKQGEIALQESNTRFENVAKATFDAIWDWNLVNGEFFMGEGFEQMLGLPSGKFHFDEINLFARIHPDDIVSLQTSIEETLAGCQHTWSFQFRAMRSNGEYAHMQDKAIIIRNEQGVATNMIGAMQDITRQVQEEARLKLLESVITHANDGVLITNSTQVLGNNVKIIYVNQAICHITGYTQDELIGQSPFLLLGHHVDNAVRQRLEQTFGENTPVESEIIQYRKDGQALWMSVSAVPVFDNNNNVTHWISIQRDITDKKRREIEREQLLTELARNNQELKQFSYITSHNLRAPLTNLMAISNMLNLDTITHSDTKMLLEGFKGSTKQLNETLNDLMNILIFKDNLNTTITTVSLQKSLDNVFISLQKIIEIAEASISLDTSAFDSIEFNPTYWESVLFHLLSNAIHFSHPNRKPVIQISTQWVDHKKQILIHDNGLGMNIDLVKTKIFGLYQKFHKNSGSKGIGLYYVKMQLNSLGANIDVQSSENEGSTFTITFPEI
jgi:PAS domain S-box-containing protein